MNEKGKAIMAAKIMFLQLSDIHLSHVNHDIVDRAEVIAATTFQHLHEVETLAIILSGDISNAGIAEEYVLAERFIDAIRIAISKESPSKNIEVFVCPGNHDCDFSKNNETREAVLSRIRSLEGNPPSESLIGTASALQNSFFQFRDKVSTQPWTVDTRLCWQTIFSVGHHLVGIRCLNVAWMSELREKQGTLVFPQNQIKNFAFDNDSGLSVTVLHHPFNWFGQTTYRAFQSAVRRESQLIFTGHEHFQNVGEVSDIRTSPSIFVEGGVLFDPSARDYSTFNIVTVDLVSEQYSAELYRWNGTSYLAEVDNEEWGSLRALPVKESQRCELTPEFVASLKDVGANFSHSAKRNLLLDDVFVWPELLWIDDPAPIKKQVSGAFFEDVQNVNSGVFIRGNEQSGKSTLLRQYFSSYYGRGYLPLYFKCNWFTKAHVTAPLKAIRYALERQYKKSSHQSWLQEPKTKKVLLLDDVDLTTLSPSSISDALGGMFEYFSTIIVTAKDGSASMDVLSIERIETINHFSQYEIREFGYKKRFELVCKWAAIGGLEDESSKNWMGTIDKWEKDLTLAVGRQFVPSAPIFLLTLLQSIESGRTADLQNSAFGHYYQFLITSALQNIGVEREQWNEFINYCSNLAWYMHSTGKKNCSEAELEKFNSVFSAEFTPVSFARRLRELTSAGILTLSDGEIEFKYPYLYFYFLGQYFADRIHEPEIHQSIIGLCDDLHLSENANILLFASHHTKSPVIYETIANALDRCFKDEEIFDFERDVALLNQLVDSAPQLIYHDGLTKENRAKIREQQDNSEYQSEQTEDLDTSDETNLVASVTRLFRGMEILGQFLKNHYGTTKNPVKDELIDKLLQSSLRGLRGTTLELIQSTESLATHIERILADSRRDLTPVQLKAGSRRVVFDLIGMITFGFVQKAGASIGSTYLKDNLRNVVDKNGTLAYSLIETSHQLDLPEKIPMSKLRDLNKIVENNMFSRELLRSMALKHLHLFKVPYKDKQRLCAELDIALSQQQALQYDRSKNLKGT